MAEIVKPYKIGNYWTNLVDSSTGENVNYEEVTEWFDGTPMDDTKVDGNIYRKLPDSVGGGYVKKVVTSGNTLKKPALVPAALSGEEAILVNIGHYTQLETAGYYSEGDGGAGVYEIVDSGSYTPNSFNLIGLTPMKVGKLVFSSTTISAAVGGIIDGAIVNITNRLSTIIGQSYPSGVRRIDIPKGTYESNQLTGLNNKENLTLDFNGSVVNYHSLDGRRLFYVENSDNLTIRNLVSRGQMFSGLDVNTVSGLPVDAEALNRSETHRLITAINCNKLQLKNISAEEYYMVLDIRNSRDIDIHNVSGQNINTGATLANVSGSVYNCSFLDCRFEFSRLYTAYEADVTTAQGSGMIITPYANELLKVTSCRIERCWTNGYRVQGAGGRASFYGCEAHQNGRHGFSNYGSGTVVELYDCSVTDLADPTFWTGTLEDNTYKVPVRRSYPVAYSFQGYTNSIVMERCSYQGPLYNNTSAPLREDMLGPLPPATVPNGWLRVFTAAGETQRHRKVLLKDCLFRGFTAGDSNYASISNVDTFGTTVVNCIFEAKTGVDANYPFGEDSHVIRTQTDHGLISGCSVIGGWIGIRAGGVTSLNRYIRIENCYVQNSVDCGIQVSSAAGAFPQITGNIVKNVPGTSYRPDFRCSLSGNTAHNTTAVPAAAVVAIGNLTSEPDVVASALNGINPIGLFTAVLSSPGVLTGRQRLLARPSINGNISSPTSNDVLIRADLDNLVASSSDTATVTDPDASSVLTELRDLKTKMRTAGLLAT